MRSIPSTMPDRPLSIGSILDHAVRKHPRKGVVSRDGEGMVRISYAGLAKRVARLANALQRMGVRPGDRVASFAWNGHRHLELYYAVPMMGAVLHTVNIRLFPSQVAELLDHAQDRIVFYDVSLAAAVKAFRALGPDAQRTFVSMGETAQRLDGALDYETLLAAESESYDWPDVDERSGAILCYTSATTGDPKGVLFSHRSTYLHALVAALPDFLGPKERDRILPIVPMFHVNAWGLPFIAPLIGADLIMPMERLDPRGVVDLCRGERVTLSAGVPTVWMAVRDLLQAQNERIPTLEHLIVGGSAMPKSLSDDLEKLGIEAVHAWGMTEMSPLGTVTSNTSLLEDDPDL
ncbi:MAG TPA: AMP-binding protein, partial [Candidatus Aquilonibacter sp.]